MNTQEFLQEVYGRVQGFVAIHKLPINKTAFMATDALKEAAEHAVALAEWQNVYVGVGLLKEPKATGRGETEDIICIPALFADLDTLEGKHGKSNLPRDMEHVRELLKPFSQPSILVHTGGGAQAWWVLEEPLTDMQQAARIMEGFQVAIQAHFAKHGLHMDITSDLTRIGRVPGTRNRKPHFPRPPEVRVVEQTGIRYPVDTFRPYAPVVAPPQEPQSPAPLRISDTPVEGIKSKLDMVSYTLKHFEGEAQREPSGEIRITGNGGLLINPEKGVWHNFSEQQGGDALDLVGFVLYGKDYDKHNGAMFRTVLEAAAQEVGEDYQEHKPDTIRSLFTLLTARELKKRPAPRWLVQEVLVQGSMGALVGAPGSYKSFIALDLALSVADGRLWHGRDVHQGPVVYISAEGSSGMGKRITAWEKHNNTTAPECCYFLPEAVQLLEMAQVEALLAVIANLPEAPSLVIVDTVARCLVGGEENSNKDMGLFVAGADAIRRATGAHVLLIHHVTKSTGTIRGASALPGALDTIIEAKRDGDSLSLTCTKQKDAAEFSPVYMLPREVVVSQLEGSSSLVLEHITKGSGTLNAAAKRVLTILTDTFGQEGATSSQWEKACEEANIPHTSYFRARKDLVEAEYVVADKEGRGARYRATGKAVGTTEYQIGSTVPSGTAFPVSTTGTTPFRVVPGTEGMDEDINYTTDEEGIESSPASYPQGMYRWLNGKDPEEAA